MPTLKELKKLATQHKIKGRSKMNKSQLEKALAPHIRSVKKSRKVRAKKPVKKPAKKSVVSLAYLIVQAKVRAKKPVKKPAKKSRKVRVKKSRKPIAKKKSGKKVKTSSKLTVHPKKAGKGWVTVVVPKGTLLYRGELASRSNTMLQNMSGNEPRPTWYTKELENAMSYLPFGANGNLYVYRTTKDLKMFKLDSAKNANKLFEMFHNDDVKIFPGMGRGKKAMKSKGNPMMNFLIHIYLGEYSLKRNSKSYKLINGIPQVTSDKDLKRASILPYDLAFARWLCHNGFSGYDQGKMAGKHSKVFDDEVCICLPHKNLELVDVFQFPKGVGKKTARQGTFQTAVKNTKSRVRNAKWYKKN